MKEGSIHWERDSREIETGSHCFVRKLNKVGWCYEFCVGRKKQRSLVSEGCDMDVLKMLKSPKWHLSMKLWKICWQLFSIITI